MTGVWIWVAPFREGLISRFASQRLERSSHERLVRPPGRSFLFYCVSDFSSSQLQQIEPFLYIFPPSFFDLPSSPLFPFPSSIFIFLPAPSYSCYIAETSKETMSLKDFLVKIPFWSCWVTKKERVLGLLLI